MISLTSEERQTISTILARYLPQIEVRIFGSRTRRNHKRFSDLDLALMTERPLSLQVIGRLREAFSESNLRFRVDLLDWAATSDSVKKNVAGQLVSFSAAATTTGE